MSVGRVGIVLGIGFMLTIAACQPQVVMVEVTRLVESSAPSPATPSPPPLEVTRLVPQEVTRLVPQEVIITVTSAPVGAPTRPLQLLFSPVADTAVLMQRAQPLADALAAATGRHFTIGIVDDEQTVIDLMCAAPAETLGFLSASGYMLAQAQCGVVAAGVGVNATGQPWQMGMIVARADSDIQTLADLAGKTWATPDETSLPATLYFQALLADAGVTPGNVTVVPGDSAAMLAVLNGEVDFATASFIPPVMPYETRAWVYGEDDPEVWRTTGILPGRSGIGFVIVNGGPENGGYRVRDARSGILDTNRLVFRDTEIVALSAPMPNETIAFGADFPVSVAHQVTAVLATWGASEACRASLCASDVYGWSTIAPAADAEYEPLRFIADTLDLSAEDLLGK